MSTLQRHACRLDHKSRRAAGKDVHPMACRLRQADRCGRTEPGANKAFYPPGYSGLAVALPMEEMIGWG